MLFEQVDGALHHTLRSSNPIGKLNGPVAPYSDRAARFNSDRNSAP